MTCVLTTFIEFRSSLKTYVEQPKLINLFGWMNVNWPESLIIFLINILSDSQPIKIGIYVLNIWSSFSFCSPCFAVELHTLGGSLGNHLYRGLVAIHSAQSSLIPPLLSRRPTISAHWPSDGIIEDCETGSDGKSLLELFLLREWQCPDSRVGPSTKDITRLF